MKKQKLILLAVILLLCFIVISVIVNQKRNIKKEQITIKEMSETTQVSDLQEQINQLNASHTEYANYVQSYKQAIATAITNQGVYTSSNSTAEVMSENIGKILQARTKDATATANNITEGKTAYVNGELITGIGKNQEDYLKKITQQICNNSTVSNTLSGYSGVSLSNSGWYQINERKEANFKSELIPIYKDLSGNTALLSQIIFPINKEASYNDTTGCKATADVEYSLVGEDGIVIKSETLETSKTITFDLLKLGIGNNEKLYLTLTGSIYAYSPKMGSGYGAYAKINTEDITLIYTPINL